jgi:hypothetical protein
METCSHCGRENQNATPYCQECGMKFEAGNLVDEPISTSEKRRFWFGAWGIVILITLVMNPASIITAPLFPVGLFALFPNGDDKAIVAWGTGSFIIGWVFYILLSIIMFITKKKGVFFLLYIIFCILLALNISGCQRILKDMSHIR